jgi:predicted transcriptional regulator
MAKINYSLTDFMKIFEDTVTVNDISEFNLYTCKSQDSVQEIEEYMKSNGFDIFPIEAGGRITRYINRSNLYGNKCEDCAILISPELLITNSTPLIPFIEIMKNKDFLFVLKGNKISGIVTKADLQKLPVRIFLFGLMSLLEMQLLSLIRKYYEGDSWKTYISPERLKKAEQLHNARKNRNEEIGLIDCLQLCDKKTLILKKQSLLDKIGYSKKILGELLQQVEELRDKLAHAQEINTGYSWSDIIDLVPKITEFVQKCDK